MSEFNNNSCNHDSQRYSTKLINIRTYFWTQDNWGWINFFCWDLYNLYILQSHLEFRTVYKHRTWDALDSCLFYLFHCDFNLMHKSYSKLLCLFNILSLIAANVKQNEIITLCSDCKKKLLIPSLSKITFMYLNFLSFK